MNKGYYQLFIFVLQRKIMLSQILFYNILNHLNGTKVFLK